MEKDITPEQEKQLEEVKQEYLKYIFSYQLKFDEQKCVNAIKWLWEFCGYRVPRIYITDSPIACQIIYDELRTEYTRDGKLMSNDEILKSFDKETTKDKQRLSQENLNEIARKKIASGFSKKNLPNKTDFSAYGNIWDYGWCSFYDFYTRTNKLNNDLFVKYLELIKSGVYDMIQLELFCIICKLPSKIHVDDAYKLHCVDDAAIGWDDGYEAYFWHGVEVPKKLIQSPDEITNKDIILEKNVEVRRCYQEKLGSKRFAEILDIELVDKDVEPSGYPIELFRTKEKDNIINDYIWFSHFFDPSTKREYFICIKEPKLHNVWSAKASTFGKEAEQFKPRMET